MKPLDPKTISALKESGYFDQEWYLDRYPDVRASSIDPAEHFVRIGAAIGRDPSASYSNADYLKYAAEQSEKSPILPGATNEDGPGSVTERILSNEIAITALGNNFDDERYFNDYPSLSNGEINAYQHFITAGFAEGRLGSFFDNEWYMNQHKDVQFSGGHGLSHYRRHGKAERRQARFIEIKSVVENPKNVFSNVDYQRWIDNHDALNSHQQYYALALNRFEYKPLISILMPVYKAPLKYLDLAIRSVLSQSYGNLQLCIADDCSQDEDIAQLIRDHAANDSRVTYVLRDVNGHISESTNSALNIATGEFVGLIDHDDALHPHALFWIVEHLNKDRDADLIYTDEDKIDENDRRYDPHFKSDFNYELFLAQNMVSHFAVYRSSVLREIGGFRRGFEGSQDYDMTLRFIDSDARKVAHIPRVLYHWRAIEGSTALAPSEKSYTEDASILALRGHLARTGKDGSVTVSPEVAHFYRVRFDLIGTPLVSILIPTKDRVDLLAQCIDSIRNLSSYKNYEIIVINNGSEEEHSLRYFDTLASQGVTVINDDLPFNYSRVNNLGLFYAKGDHICLMNNDIEVISSDWMEEMLSFSQWPDVGCVGARLWYPDNTLQHGGVIIGIGGVAGHSHKHLDKGGFGYFGRAVLPQALSAVTAACLMIKASALREVGGLDEGLSVAFNDVDLCLRIRAAGYRNVWTPYAEMYHHESASRGAEDTPEKQARFNCEVEFMKNRWGDSLSSDPYYSPNLTADREDFSFASPPRVPSIIDLVNERWLSTAAE